jgi:hypothetical protein
MTRLFFGLGWSQRTQIGHLVYQARRGPNEAPIWKSVADFAAKFSRRPDGPITLAWTLRQMSALRHKRTFFKCGF